MPGFDGTGPRGMGPRTGGARGFCPPGSGPYYGYGAWPLRGTGRGGGRGRGGCWPKGYYAYGGPHPYGAYGSYDEPSVGQEIVFLKNQAASMEQTLEQIRKRIEELSRKEAKEK